MSAPTVTSFLRRAGGWLVEPADRGSAVPSIADEEPPVTPAPHRHPAIGVVGLARRCGSTTLARALGAELAARCDGAAVVTSPGRPAIVALGSSAGAARLTERVELESPRAAGRLCLATCADPEQLVAATRHVAPAVMEVEPGSPALEAAPVLDRLVLVATPALEPALAGAVAETIAAAAESPVVAVNRALDHGPWLPCADVLVPDSRVGARLALAGREPRGFLGKSIEQLADLCGAD